MTETNQESDVLDFLEQILPDTPENRLIERQELFRIALTQAMRNIRNKVGLTQKELAEKLGVTQSWVSKLESANNDHTFESVLAYLNALTADFEAVILLNGQQVTTIAAQLGLDRDEIDFNIDQTINLDLSTQQTNIKSTQVTEFNLISSEQQQKCQQAKQVITHLGMWGAVA